jgi:hypothetical protein
VALRDRLPLALLALFCGVVYLPHLLIGEVLPARDVAATQIPWRTVWRQQVLSGTPPLWDPFSNGGRPLLANPNTMAAYPGTLLFLLMAPEVGSAWHIALHHLLLLLGCYRLARRSGAAPASAAVAAAVAGSCGVAWSGVTFLNFQASLTWAFWALATALPPPTSGAAAVRRGLAGGALIGLSFLAGEPITAGFAGIAWAAVVVTTWRPVPWKALLAMGGGAFAVAAPVLVPLLAIYPETVRGALSPAEGALCADALAPRRFLELLFPNLLGPPLADLHAGFWAAPSFPWQRYYPLIFLGAGPLLCLPFARRAGRTLTPWWVIAAAGALGATVLSVPAIANPAQQVPFLGSVRFAIKFLVLTTLALPPLVAAGWEGLAARWVEAGRRWSRVLLLTGMCLAPLAIGPDRLMRPLLAELYPASRASLAEVQGAQLRRAALLDWVALVLPIVTVALAGPAPVAATAAVLVANALGGSGALLFADAATWAQPPAARAKLREAPTVAVLELPEKQQRGGALPPLERFWWMHEGLFPEYGTRWGVSYVLTRGPDGLEPVHQELLAAASGHMSAQERARLARSLGADAVICTAPVQGWTGGTVGTLWLGVAEAGPRAYLARRLLPAQDMLNAATILAAASFRAGEDAVVVRPGGAREAGGGTVVELSGQPHDRRFDIAANAAGLLVVQQSYMRCWRATVDGTPTAIGLANGACTGVPVPAGRHRVRLFLDATPYRLGLLGPLLLLLVTILSRRAGTSPGHVEPSGGVARSSPANPPGP